MRHCISNFIGFHCAKEPVGWTKFVFWFQQWKTSFQEVHNFVNFHDIQRSNSALSQVSAWHALDHKPLLLPNISHGSTSWILIFENLPFQFSTDQTRLRLLKKVLILHAEKGLVRAGTPDLTLFHQVRSTNMHQIAKSPTCTKSTNHQITNMHQINKSPNHQTPQAPHHIHPTSCSGLLSALLGRWACPLSPFSQSSG